MLRRTSLLMLTRGHAADQKQVSDTHSSVRQSLRGTVGCPYQCHRVCSLKALGPIRILSLLFRAAVLSVSWSLSCSARILNTAAFGKMPEPLQDSSDSSQEWQFTMRKAILWKADKLTYENTGMRVSSFTNISEHWEALLLYHDRVITGFKRMTLH